MPKHKFTELEKAIGLLGGYEAVGRICKRSGKAVKKWVNAGRLPRTKATGETSYAEAIAAADKRINKANLLASVMRGQAA